MTQSNLGSTRATSPGEVVDAIQYIVSAVVRSWRDASKPGDTFTLAEIEQIGQTLLEQAIAVLGEGPAEVRFIWQPDYGQLVELAFRELDGIDSARTTPKARYMRLAEACEQYLGWCSDPVWRESDATRYVGGIHAETHEMLQVLEGRVTHA